MPLYDLITLVTTLAVAALLVVYVYGKAQTAEHRDYRAIGAQVLELTAEVARLAYRILALEKVIAEHENGIGLLVAQVAALDPEARPAYQIDGLGKRDGRGHLAVVRFYELLATYFDLSELIDLCFQLGATKDDIEGDTRADRAQEMVLYFNRRGRLHELAKAAKLARPNVQWPEIA